MGRNNGNHFEPCLILYGLRRTGKMTLIRQCIMDMNEAQRDRTVFIQVQHRFQMYLQPGNLIW